MIPSKRFRYSGVAANIKKQDNNKDIMSTHYIKTRGFTSHGCMAVQVLLLIMATSLPPVARAEDKGNSNPGILPINSRAFDRSYGEWADAWVQWAYSIPADHNPILDQTGQDAGVGQSGKVWFLAGSFGVPAVRNITVPEGKALFFPVAEWVWVNMPQFGDNPWSPAQEVYARGVISGLVDQLVNLSCEVDGREVANLLRYRAETPENGAFMMDFPDNNVWGVPAGTYGPSVVDGYWLMLAPLSHGRHTVRFTAGQGYDPTWDLDVTYHITVTDKE